MKTIKTILPKTLIFIGCMTLLCGVLYPMTITGIAQIFFQEKADGSIIEADGIKYGSSLLGQEFTQAGHLWGRIVNPDLEMAKDEAGNPLFYGEPSNLSPASEEYALLVAERVAMIQKANPEAEASAVPVDLVTSSGSGMDPHISVEAARYQIPRIARERGITEREVEAVIEEYTTNRFAGVLGEKVVNVLLVNLTLDGKLQ